MDLVTFSEEILDGKHFFIFCAVSATQRILLGGNMEMNPEPTSTINTGSTSTNNKQNINKATTKRKAPICSVCEKTA